MSDDDFVEEEVEFSDDTVYIIDRLVDEGRFQDRSDFVGYAVEMREIESSDDFRSDPGMDQRIEELNQINDSTEEEFLRDFFADTSYMMQQYARLANEAESKTHLTRINSYLSRQLAPSLGADDMEENEANQLIDRTIELTNDFWNLSDAANAGYESIIEEYEETYFDRDEELVKMLTDQ